MSYGRGRGGGYGGGNRFGRGRGGGGGRGGSRAPRKYDARKIFVGGVSRRDTDASSFEQFFSNFGEIEDIILMKAVDGSGHRGFGFVTYQDQKVSDSVLAKVGDLELDGKRIDVKMALPEELKPPEGSDGTKIFVGSLPKEDFGAEDLKEYFGQWGSVTDSYVSPGRGFGFITYESCTGAYKALIHGSNHGHTIGSIDVSAKWPIPKEAPAPSWQSQGGGYSGRGFGGGGGGGGRGRFREEYSRDSYARAPRFQQDVYGDRGYSSGGRYAGGFSSGGRYQAFGRERSRPY